ncbi:MULTISPECIES: UPF0175 family protein [Imperialibacter]|uniref:UPF0175 family protein n=1 Tax=Imperialibacter roseus TaxID=1324217 RepID=A0ABZ0IJ46_9BACT|nr:MULTISPECIES: UPF0175 family protein [Imperialibacter]WOK04542.1 UPF0175 family protein [Imperialibacter roseus]CAD5277705.1 Predicted antitoxin, contains HTH domain [Imperialibacter sp. 89]CAD5292029.1 Predicted antitoxin, contains HTH domain [Imperialibacter sp. 75]VVT00224.1 Predicted antitoxin, contains HTH domain [Imperialibacter sp. EC-SDR9]
MKNVTIPVEIPSDIMLALNESEEELKDHLQVAVAIMLFHEGKLTIGKAIQLSGLTRYEFEKSLAKSNLPVSNPSIEQVMADLETIKKL